MSGILHIGQIFWHRFAMLTFCRPVPGVSAAPQPPANGWQPFGLARRERLSALNHATGKVIIGSENGSVYCFGVKEK